MPITFTQLRDKLQQFLSPDFDGSGDSSRLWAFLTYGVENYEELDAEGKAYIERIFDQVREGIQAKVDNRPDSVEKRKLLRQLGFAGGRHIHATGLIGALEARPRGKVAVLPAAREVFSIVLQDILDILFDVTGRTHQGPAGFAKIALCYWAVDELVCSFHLAQRTFTNQSYAHIRTTFEILDLVDLFNKQPRWAEVWASQNQKRVWDELRPAAVRKKLGSPRFNPVYSFLSQLGPHGTFPGVQARSAQFVGQGDRKRFKIWVGGAPHDQHIVLTNSLGVIAALMLLASCGDVFANFLNADEMKGVLEASHSTATKFLNEYFIKWAKDEGLNYQPVEEYLNRGPWASNASKT